MERLLGEKILLLCKERGISKRGLAKKANLTAKTVSYVINNKRRKPAFLTLRKIATVLDVEMQVILMGE